MYGSFCKTALLSVPVQAYGFFRAFLRRSVGTDYLVGKPGFFQRAPLAADTFHGFGARQAVPCHQAAQLLLLGDVHAPDLVADLFVTAFKQKRGAEEDDAFGPVQEGGDPFPNHRVKDILQPLFLIRIRKNDAAQGSPVQFAAAEDAVPKGRADGGEGFAARGVAEMLAKKQYAAVFACGPKIMLKTTFEAARAAGVPCWVSLEERMGCGLGACLTCATPIRGADGQKVMKEACKDGPVFRGGEVIWDG